MENKLHTIKIKSTDGSSRAEFRRQFHLIWNKLDIERHRVKKEENKVRENLIASGLSVTNYTEPIPPKIDLNLLVEEGEYTAEEYKQFISQEMAIVTEERKEIIPFSEFESTKSEKKPTTTQKIKVLNTPMLIQIIGENKHLIKIEARLLDDLIALLVRGDIDAYDVVNNNHYRAITNFVKTNYKDYKPYKPLWDSLGNTVGDTYKTKLGVDVTKENLMKLIHMRYLVTPNFIEEVNAFWKNIIQKIKNKELSVNDVLLNPNYAELLHYIENFEQGIPKQKVNVEKYREALIHKVAQVYNEKKRVRDKTLLEKLKNHSISLLDIMKEHQEVFLILSALEIDIQQFNEYKVYPKLNLIYKEFALSKWYANLGVNNIYFKRATSKFIINKDGTYEGFLDEIIINALAINLEKKTTLWGSIMRYEAETMHVFEYLIKKAGKISSFREAVPYVKDHEITIKVFANLVVDNLEFSIHGFSSSESLEVKLDLRSECIKVSKNKDNGIYSYYIHFKDEKGGQKKYYIQTKDYLAFEMLVKKLGVNLKASFTESLADEYIKGIRKSGDQPSRLSKYYTSLPTSTYRTKQGLRDNKRLPFSQLKKDLETVLKQRFIVSSTLIEGVNEELAVLNILKAMPPKDMYKYLYENTKILYKIVKSLDGVAYENFVKYLSATIAGFNNTNSNRAIYFSNNSRSERDIHVNVTDWEGEQKINFENYSQNTTFYIPHGKTKALNLNGVSYHPLELVSFKTIINNKEVEALKVPAFYLHNKINKQGYWDWFEIALDVVSVASLYGSARFIISSAIKHAGKKVTRKELIKRGLAYALIAKDVSSFGIRNEDFSGWMIDSGYKNLLTTWKILDTTGDLIYLGSSLKSLKKINLKKVKEGVQQGFDKNIVESYTKFKQYIYEVDEVIQKLVQEGKEVSAKLRQHIFDLEKDLNIFLDNVIVANGPEYQLAFAMLDNSAKTGKRLNFEAAFDAVGNARNTRKAERVAEELAKKAAIKKKYGIEHLTIQQSKYFEAIEELNITNKELLEKVIQHGKNTSGVTISPKKVADNIKKGWKYDIEAKRWKSPYDSKNSDRADRLIETLKKAKYSKEVIEIARDIKKYYTKANKQFKALVKNDVKVDPYIKLLKSITNSQAKKLYQPLLESIEALKKQKNILDKDIIKVLEDFRRHHIFPVDVFADNPTFQKLLDWGAKNGRPFKFNDLGENLILIHKSQHTGGHLKYTERIFEEITEKLLRYTRDIPDKVKMEARFEMGYNELQKMLKNEIKNINKKVIREGENLNNI
ncbi:hypothetical protein [uncultured Tenacibaculum sp.]|uniref:hypothetical protein n=1 Tax=uncultured Tenacibaculum sp. TaxID=174713 RepID=UPI002625C4A6|nr:hypothetical protein [uncultured Tenacibaculum sp.]